MNAQLASRLRVCLGVVIFIASLCCAPYLFFLGMAGWPFPAVVTSPLSAFLSVALTVFSVCLGAPASVRGNWKYSWRL
jgi:hypothetical protein